MTPSETTIQEAERLMNLFETVLVEKQKHVQHDPVDDTTRPDILVPAERVLLRTFLYYQLEGELK
jgi:hypothetical protein